MCACAIAAFTTLFSSLQFVTNLTKATCSTRPLSSTKQTCLRGSCFGRNCRTAGQLYPRATDPHPALRTEGWARPLVQKPWRPHSTILIFEGDHACFPTFRHGEWLKHTNLEPQKLCYARLQIRTVLSKWIASECQSLQHATHRALLAMGRSRTEEVPHIFEHKTQTHVHGNWPRPVVAIDYDVKNTVLTEFPTGLCDTSHLRYPHASWDGVPMWTCKSFL